MSKGNMGSIRKFVYSEVLNSDAQAKFVVLLGTIEGTPAVVTLEKAPFPESQTFFEKLGSNLVDIRNLDTNDIYSWNVATVAQDVDTAPAAKITVIHPATETHINKARRQNRRLVKETPQMYIDIVVPYIATMKGDRLNWVDNILHHGAEADRVIFRDTDPVNGFVLLPNMRWDRKTMESLYLVAIVERSDLASIRDLNTNHVSFLRYIRDEIVDVVSKKFQLDVNQLKLYFHCMLCVGFDNPLAPN
jgi:m7GpppX diphosphatase